MIKERDFYENFEPNDEIDYTEYNTDYNALDEYIVVKLIYENEEIIKIWPEMKYFIDLINEILEYYVESCLFDNESPNKEDLLDIVIHYYCHLNERYGIYSGVVYKLIILKDVNF
uniref:Uncharacterized protein n=1 Tax=Pithovirus LCDPAC02 TaxID=2506601 RepID=A0A481YNF9_9VIRU|nr:MAG: hypothetical protein LCDPAC02_00720 [Pithovirus LCDPAC02]